MLRQLAPLADEMKHVGGSAQQPVRSTLMALDLPLLKRVAQSLGQLRVQLISDARLYDSRDALVERIITRMNDPRDASLDAAHW